MSATQPATRKPRRLRPLARVIAMLGAALLPAVLLSGDLSPLGVFASGLGAIGGSTGGDGDQLGATGRLPQQTAIDPRLLAEFRDSQSPVPNPAVAKLVAANGSLGIPSIPLDAYHRAEAAEARLKPDCHVDWALLASIGRIESNHAENGSVDANGTSTTPILGPELNGTQSTAAVPDSDGGAFDGDTTWDRAVGPMQFIPATWRAYATQGNPAGQPASPHNVYDATQAAAKYLCAEGGDLRDPAQAAMAVFRYNQSDSYVQVVLAYADAYRHGVAVLPDFLGPVTPVHPGPGQLPLPGQPVALPLNPGAPVPPPGVNPPGGNPPAPQPPVTTVTIPWGPPPSGAPATDTPPPSGNPQPTGTPQPSTTTTTPPPPTTSAQPSTTTAPPPPSTTGPATSTAGACPTTTTTPAPTTTTTPAPSCTPMPSATGQAAPADSPPPSTTKSQMPAQ